MVVSAEVHELQAYGILAAVLLALLAVRRSLGISVYTLGAPYPELKSRVLGKWMETEDYMILALRPDLKVSSL